LASRARPCAARTRLFGHIASPNGALRAPPPIKLRCFLFDTKNIYNLSNLGRPRQGIFSFHWTTEAMKYEVPCPRPTHRSFADPSCNIFGVKLCTDATIRPYFLRFFLFFFSFWIFSFCCSLLFLLSFSISSYSFLLILLFLSFSSYIFLFFS
jgi:hypothetical protein